MSGSPTLWNSAHRLILASNSATRRALLDAAGLPFTVDRPDVDERALEEKFLARGVGGEGLPAVLARAKALEVSRRNPDALCLGADQVLSLDGEIFHKAYTPAEAERNLARLAGRTHRLTSALAVARDGEVLHEAEDSAGMTMRALTAPQIALYLSCAGPEVLASVGAYQLETLGVHLFQRVDGDNSVILGLPMLALLSYLRSMGALLL